MALNYRLEALARIFNLSQHRILHITIPDDVHVAFVLLLSFSCASFLFKTGLVEVDFFRHDDSLHGHKHLEDRAQLRVPVFRCTASPGVKQGQAYLATGIEIWVEADLAGACCAEVHLWGTTWISILAEDVKLIAAMGVRRAGRSCDQSLHQVNTGLINAHEDGIGVFTWKSVTQISQFLGKSDNLRLGWRLVLSKTRLVMMFVIGRISLHIHILKAKFL